MGLVDHFSIHRYWVEGGPGLNFSENDHYRLLAEADETESFIVETRAILSEYAPAGRIGIALDEWGVWHPESRGWGPGGCSEPENDYTQAATLRDAIAAAVAFEGFHRQAASLSLANLAQVVNVLHAPVQTEGAHMWLTPTYHLLRQHRHHLGATALRTEVEEAPALPNGKPGLSATASIIGGRRAVTVTNRHLRETAVFETPDWAKNWEILTGQAANAANTLAFPEAVKPGRLSPRNGLVELPPHSVATATS
jgi:alpha-N-arabinofuranosidase